MQDGKSDSQFVQDIVPPQHVDLGRELDIPPGRTLWVGQAEVVLGKSPFCFVDIDISWWGVEVHVTPGIVDRNKISQPLPLLSAHRCVAKDILEMYHEKHGGDDAHHDEEKGASRTPWLVISSEA